MIGACKHSISDSSGRRAGVTGEARRTGDLKRFLNRFAAKWLCALVLGSASLLFAQVAVAEDASGMKLVGSDPLQGRSAYQVIPHQVNGRWILYVGQMPGRALNPLTGRVEDNGMSILDVTDPSRPKFLHHEPPGDTSWYRGKESSSGTYHIQVCDGARLPKGTPGKVYVLRALGPIAHEVLDVTDPAATHRVSLVRVGRSDAMGTEGTHNSFWDCSSGIAYMVSSVPKWRARRILQVYDLGDPANPRHVRDFGLPEMGPDTRQPGVRPKEQFYGASAHAAEVAGDKLYMSYSPFSDGTLQILDVKKLLAGDPGAADPLKPTDESLRYPQIGRLDFPSYWGVHTAKPILGMKIPGYASDKPGAVRDILVVVSEGGSVKCDRPRHIMFFLDITEPAFPMPISTYQASEKEGNYCGRQVYFGPHNIQALSAPMYDKKLLFVTYFAGGVRIVDIRNPFSPVEVGHYIPAANANTRYVESKGPWAGVELEPVPETNGVDVDARGYVYITDRAHTGLHILELTGLPKQIADSK